MKARRPITAKIQAEIGYAYSQNATPTNLTSDVTTCIFEGGDWADERQKKQDISRATQSIDRLIATHSKF